MIERIDALNMADEHIGSLMANLHATLLNSGEHRVASHRTLTIRKATDADVLRNPETHTLGRI